MYLGSAAGARSAFGSAVGCGVLLGVFEGAQLYTGETIIRSSSDWSESKEADNRFSGVGVLMNRMFAQPIPQMQRAYLAS